MTTRPIRRRGAALALAVAPVLALTLAAPAAAGTGPGPTAAGVATVGAATTAVSATDVSSATGLPRDLDGDGRGELLAVDAGGLLWSYPVDRVFARERVGTGWNGRDLLTYAGDWDGDGSQDVVARDPGSGSGRLWLYRGDGAGGWLGARVVGTGWGSFDHLVSPGDWDGDDDPDLVGATVDGTLWLYPGNGSGGFEGARRIGTGWDSMRELVVTGDVDGDGLVDLVAVAEDGRLWLYRGDGDGGFRPGRAQIGSGWQAFTALVGVGDWTGRGEDGLLDLVGQRVGNPLHDPSGSGTMYVYEGTGLYPAAAPFTMQSVFGTGWKDMRLFH